MNFSQAHSLKPVRAIAPITLNNDTEGTGLTIDTRDCEAVLFVFDIGVSGDTLAGDLKLDLKLQHADADADGSDPETGDFTTVTDADHIVLADADLSVAAGGEFATIDAAAEDDVLVVAAYVGTKPFVRAFVDTTGTHTTGTLVAAYAVKGHLKESVGGAVPATNYDTP